MDKINEQFQWDVCELRSPKMNLLEMSCTLRLGKIPTDNILYFLSLLCARVEMCDKPMC